MEGASQTAGRAWPTSYFAKQDDSLALAFFSLRAKVFNWLTP